MDIGSRIKHKREMLKMSQEELAQKVGYKSRSSINKIELDGRGLPQSKIVAFAKALETTPAYLMGWEHEIDYIAKTDSGAEFLIETRRKHSHFSKEESLEFKLLDIFSELMADNKQKIIEYAEKVLEIQNFEAPVLKAAHERTDIKVTDEMRKHDDKIMDSDDF